jgi:hypothetical protein
MRYCREMFLAMALELCTVVRAYTVDMEGLTTAKLAKEGGVNVETIRYYERHGLLPKAARTPSGYRKFSRADATRLRVAAIAAANPPSFRTALPIAFSGT